MAPETVFLICNYGVLPAWALLVCAPRWAWTQRIVHAIWIPLGFGLAYGWALLANPAPPPGGSFATLGGVMALFGSPYVALAGWLHYLVFDLFVGAWETRDAVRRGIGRWWVAPCLLLTLMLGPLGLLAYLLIRLLHGGGARLAEAAA